MNILVTGGAGFIGSNVALECEQQGHTVTVVDDFSRNLEGEKNLEGFSGTIVKKDISQDGDVEGDFDVIIHEAAITDPRHDNDEETIRINIEGFKKIIALAQKNNAKLVYASSASLYGHGPSPQQEDQEKDLLSAYAKSKLQMDEMASELFSDMHIVGLRYFNVFGPREAGKGKPASMIYHLYNQMKKGEKPKLFKFGEHKRDHIYVKDVVKATLLGIDAPSGVYNVGTGVGTTFNEVVAALNSALGTQLEPEYIDNPFTGTYQEDTCADMTKAKNELKFTLDFSFKEAVKDYVQWMEKQ